MLLPKMIFNALNPQDLFGLKVIKDGYNPSAERNRQRLGIAEFSDLSNSKYFKEVIVMETKQMNTSVKMQFLDDYTETLKAHEKGCAKNNMDLRDAQ